MIDRLLSAVAPHSCCGCGNVGVLLCHQCNYDIVSDAFAQCIVCLHPTSDTNLCRRCAAKTRLHSAWCVGERTGALKALIDQYKFHSAVEASNNLSALLDARLPILPSSTVIVPVPTAPSHRRVRGFDHTLAIAQRFGKHRQMKVRSVLESVRADTQHFKTRSQRLAAAQHGLSIRGAVPEHILLVDDIYTTGATVLACATILRSHGAQTVSVGIIARQTLDDSADL